jgi:hypothetical protein
VQDQLNKNLVEKNEDDLLDFQPHDQTKKNIEQVTL